MSINVLAFFSHCLCSKFILFRSWAMLAFLVGGVIDFSEHDGTSPLMSQLYVAVQQAHISVEGGEWVGGSRYSRGVHKL